MITEFCEKCNGFTNHRWIFERDAELKEFELICCRCNGEDNEIDTSTKILTWDACFQTQINKKQEVKMVNVGDFTKASGMFLKADEVKKTPTVPFVITGEGQLVKSEKFGNERLHIDGEFNAQDRIFDCSKTNARVIEKTLGNDTKKWVGHQLYFEVYKTKTSDGKLVDALNIKEVK